MQVTTVNGVDVEEDDGADDVEEEEEDAATRRGLRVVDVHEGGRADESRARGLQTDSSSEVKTRQDKLTQQ